MATERMIGPEVAGPARVPMLTYRFTITGPELQAARHNGGGAFARAIALERVQADRDLYYAKMVWLEPPTLLFVTEED